MLGRRSATAAAAVMVALSGGLSAQASTAPAPASAPDSSLGAMSVVASTLPSGGLLRIGQELRSPSGTYTFIMQTDGNAVVYGPKGALWATGKRGNLLAMQSDGNLVLYSASGPATWSTGTTGNSGATLKLGDDGRLSVVSSGGAVRWNSPADPATALPANLGDRIMPGQVLAAGQTLIGPSGTVLAMQRDGNLVRYEGTKPTWWTGTSGTNAKLMLQKDGNLVIYTDRGAVWSTGTAGRGGSLLVLQGDGNVVLYAGSKPLWATGASQTPEQAREQRVVDLVNAERARAGCQPLRVDARLAAGADLHSRDMRDRNYFDHTSPEGTDPTDRAAAQGYVGGVGENLAVGYDTPESVMLAWMLSPGHRANIVQCSYKSIGVGTATGGRYQYYWTQDFGLA